MQPFNFNAGNEALRCISFAEQLLCNREFAKCKLYASRARESEPRMEQTDQIIAIADTLSASEKRISKQHIDWYGVLQVESNCCDSEIIGSNYRRLSVLLNPRNNSFPFADNAYKLVNEAWLVLSNPSRKFELDGLIRNENVSGIGTSFAGYNFIQGEMGMQQHNGSTHYSFIQEHSEQLQKQHQHQQQFGEQQLFPNQRVEYMNEGQQVAHWSNQAQQQIVQQQPQAQQQGLHWSQSQQQQLHWSQLQPEQALHWSQQQHQSLPRQTQVLNRSQPQQLLPQRSPPPQPQQVEQHWPQHQKQQPVPWHHSQPQQQPSAGSQQQKPFRQPTPPPQAQPEPSWPMHQPQSQPPIQQPLPWHHSQPQQPSAVPQQQNLLRQPTPPPPSQSHQPQTQLLLPKSPPPRQQQQPLPQSQLYQPVAQQPLPWQHSQPQHPVVHAEPEPQMPLRQPTPPPQKPLRQPTPPPQNPLRQPTSLPQNPFRQPTPPPKLQQAAIQLPVPKLEPQPLEQLPIASHQSKQQQTSARPQLQQPLFQSPPPPQQQQPLPPEPSLPKTQPLAPQPMLKPVPVVQLPSPEPQLLLPGFKKLQHQTQTQSEPQLQSQPQSQPQSLPQPRLQSQSLPQAEPEPQLQSQSQQQTLPQPQQLESQPTSQPHPESQPKSKRLPKTQAKSKPQTQSMKPPAESQDRGENEKFEEVGQQARQMAGDKIGDNDASPQIDVSSFWTGCPYCYNMYEYPGRYAECTLRCQNCKRAFHAVEVSTPPSAADSTDAYFCSWAIFPFGVSESYFNKSNAEASTWMPISNMFVVPQGENHCHVGKQKNKKPNAGPWIYIDDDQDFAQDVPPKEDSDEDWDSTKEKKKKRARSPKGKDPTSKKVKPSKVNKSKKVKRSNIGNSQPVRAAQESEGFGVPDVEVPSIPVGNPSNRAASVIASSRPGGVAKDMGKLDLNVEFSNEVEDPGKGTSGGSTEEQGVEDNVEGTAFFDGLDEFLDSLPILSVDGDGKAKAG